MNDLFRCTSAACLSLLIVSCQTPPSTPDPESAVGTKTIPSVSPYSTLSNSEINAKYRERLLEMQAFKIEMEKANSARDFATVNARAQQSLESARDARALARHLDDPAEREDRLAVIGKIIGELERLVEITS